MGSRSTVRQSSMDGREPDSNRTFNVGTSVMMRDKDHLGKPLLKVGDIVGSTTCDDDPGTVIKILQVNANGPSIVKVKWFTWGGGIATEEYITELRLVSGV